MVAEHGPWMLRLARRRAPSEAVAEEIVQEAWLAVLQGIDRFEGRSSLRTWIFSIVSHVGTRPVQQGDPDASRSPRGPASSKAPASPPNGSSSEGAPHPGGWLTPPAPWDESPEQALTTHEAQRAIGAAIDRLPPVQREVISLRDVEGWTPAEVCNALGLTETNQRVLLHRARSRVRLELESYLGNEEGR